MNTHDYICRSKLLAKLENQLKEAEESARFSGNRTSNIGWTDAVETVKSEEIVEAKPLIHAEWVDIYHDGDWHCSCCGAIVEKEEQGRHNWNWCYHCGSKMDFNRRIKE